jgi:signal transduction histidine kinase
VSGRRTIRWRLTLWYGGIFCVSSLIVLVMTYALVDRTLVETPRRIREELGVNPGQPLAGRPPRNSIFGPPGTDIGDDPRQRQAIVSAVQESIRDDVLDKLLRRSAFVLGATALLAFGAGWIVAGRALRPVHAITATARSLSESNLAARVGHRGPDDELKEMADTFDALLDRLERAFESQRNFVAAASHELRSPLTIMRARAEIPAPAISADGDFDLRATVVAQVERADRLIDALLTLTRSQGTLIASDHLDFTEIVGDVLGTLSERATESGVVLDASIRDAEVNGDAPLLERLVGNLVENAIRYNAPGGHVDVRVGGGRQPTLIVENDGPIVDAPAVASLLEPFRRGGTQRTGDGYGLGLAVVHAVAQAHGARLDLQPRPGGGLRVAVAFPALGATVATTSAVRRGG